MTLNNDVSAAAGMQEQDMVGYLIHATKEVFNTMVMMSLDDCYPLSEPITHFHCSVTSMVGLAGTYTGILSIHCPQALALRVTSSMLGMDVTEMGEDVNDALGELANMLGGYVKQSLSKGGMDINLSIQQLLVLTEEW